MTRPYQELRNRMDPKRRERNATLAEMTVERDRLKATVTELVKVLELVLLFYKAEPWNEHRQRWKEITGTDEATSKVMCDTVRAAIERANNNRRNPND